MPSSFDLPKDRRDLGVALRNAIDDARTGDLASAYVQAVASRQYLGGDRNFEIVDYKDPSNVLLLVQSPRNQPPIETVVGETAKEIGRQCRIDISPRVRIRDTTLNGVRNRAVTQGLLSFLFSRDVIMPSFIDCQKMRVEDCGCGLAISETVRTGTGWGVKVETIPIEELVFLPSGCKNMGQCNAIAWRRKVSLKWLRGITKRLSASYGRRVSLPSEGSEDYKQLGASPVTTAVSEPNGAQNSPYSYEGGGTSSATESEDGSTTLMVEFVQIYVTPDRRHVERLIMMCGSFVFLDEQFGETEMPQMPVSYAPYTPVGGIYGRSFAFPKIMGHIPAERSVNAMSRILGEVNAYGILAASHNMGIDWNRAATPSPDGSFRSLTFSFDPASPNTKLEQIKPIEINRIVGELPRLFREVAASVYPDSPIYQGEMPGRGDSNALVSSLDVMAQVQIAAGALMLAEAWAQMYRAGVELARNHYQQGDRIPLVLVDDSMAGVVLDTVAVPKSADETLAEEQQRRSQSLRWLAEGADPSLMEAMRVQSLPQQGEQRMPVAQFTIGPNVIPHPDEVDIGIASLMPRDEDREYAEIIMSVKQGQSSMVEAQIECYKRGIDKFVGGKAIWNAYRVAVLNLLSAFGDGVDPGPILLPGAGVIHRIGYMTVSTFMESPEFLMGSESCRQKVMLLLEYYQGAAANTASGVPTADEAAMMEQMRQSMSMGQAGQGVPNGMGIPQPPMMAA